MGDLVFLSSASCSYVAKFPVYQIYILAVLAAAFTAFLGCSSEPDAVQQVVNVTEIAINGYDPVSYFSGSRPVKGTEEHEYIWQDVKYQFSCKENLELFKNNPDKYAPQYGGYCAFAMSRGDYARISPEAYAIVDGKLYLTYDRDIRNAWLHDKENYISKADIIWKERKYNNK